MTPRFRLPTAAPIPDLGLDSAEPTWMARPVAQAQRAEAERAGLGLEVDEGARDVVTLTAPGVATAEALTAFVRASDQVEGDAVGALCAPYDRWQREPAFGEPAMFLRLRGEGEVSAARIEAATRVEVPVEGQAYDLPLLDTIGGRQEQLHASMALVVSLGSWAGLLWANLLGIGPALVRLLPGSVLQRPLRLAMAAVRAGSMRPEVLGLRLNRIGRGARIHRDATVEGCVLGDDVSIDAGAVVRHCVIGDGARIEAQALCLGSVLGARAVVQRRGFVSYGVLDREAVCGGTLQLGYVGPRAQLKVSALLLDQVLRGSVRVRVRDRLEDAPLGVLGAALAPDCMVGARVTVAAGRVVPPGVVVVAGDGSLLLRPAVSEPGRHRVVHGALEPC